MKLISIAGGFVAGYLIFSITSVIYVGMMTFLIDYNLIPGPGILGGSFVVVLFAVGFLRFVAAYYGGRKAYKHLLAKLIKTPE